jgi:hypothetical protein
MGGTRLLSTSTDVLSRVAEVCPSLAEIDLLQSGDYNYAETLKMFLSKDRPTLISLKMSQSSDMLLANLMHLLHLAVLNCKNLREIVVDGIEHPNQNALERTRKKLLKTRGNLNITFTRGHLDQ